MLEEEPETRNALDSLAARVRSSSNFQFNWQWYRRSPRRPPSVAEARRILALVASTPELQGFLRDSHDYKYAPVFEIEPLHEHVPMEPADEFEMTLARGAADLLGAYSGSQDNASPAQVEEVRKIFSTHGSYQAFQLVFGSVPGSACPTCADWNGHIFTNWFNGVAWDWCFCVLWEQTDLVWVGCLTDTD
jgi:hypothetical protein